MKLAEALIQRKDLETKLRHLETRIRTSARKIEGKDPVEDATALIAEMTIANRALEKITIAINRANQENGIAEMAVLRNRSRIMAEFYRDVAITARNEPSRSYLDRNDHIYVPAVDIAWLETEADRFQQEARRLDLKIQEMDWQIEIAEE